MGHTSCRQESNPSRNYHPCPKGGRSPRHPRHCKETGTVIMGLTPWQLTEPKPAGILQARQGKEETGKREIPATQGSSRICSWRKSLTLPQGQPREQSWQHLRAPSQERPEGTVSLEQDSQEATAPGQSCPSAVPTPGSLCSPGAETTKGAFQADAPWLKGQRSAWVPWTRAACDPCTPRDIPTPGIWKGTGFHQWCLYPQHTPHTLGTFVSGSPWRRLGTG